MGGRIALKNESGEVLAVEIGGDLPSEEFMVEVEDAITTWGEDNRSGELSAPNEGRLIIEMSA